MVDFMLVYLALACGIWWLLPSGDSGHGKVHGWGAKK